jgi:hypothetical protein
MGWSDFTPANQPLESRRLELPAVHPVRRQHGLNRIADDENGADTWPWSPVPLSAFTANTDQRANNGLQPRKAENTMDTSASWEGFEHEDQLSELRSGRIATEFTHSRLSSSRRVRKHYWQAATESFNG